MKRIVLFLLATIMCFSLVACEEKEEQPEQSEQSEEKVIELTPENIEEYLDINVDFINHFHGSKYYPDLNVSLWVREQEVSVWVSPKQPGEFFEADIQIEVPLYGYWFEDVDVDKETVDTDIEYSFRIPKNGEYKAEIVEIEHEPGFNNSFNKYEGMRGYKEKNDPLFIIKSVSGRFVKD